MNILILTGSPSSYAVKRIAEEAKKRDHEVTIKHPNQFLCYVSEVKGHDRIYMKNDNEDAVRVRACDFDVVIVRTAGKSIFEYACVVVDHLDSNMSIPTTANSIGMRIASNKFLTSQFLSQARVRTIRSIFSQKPADLKFIASTLSLPIVCKLTSGSQGDSVFILSDELSISTTLGAFSKSDIPLVLQRFVDSGQPRTDLRVFIVDYKISAAFQRYALASDFRANHSISGIGKNVELTDEEKELAIAAAKAIGLPVCGVDIVRDSKDNNKPFIIEINSNPNTVGIEKVTGHNVSLYIVLYAEKIGKKKPKSKDESQSEEQKEGNAFTKRIESLNETAVKPGMSAADALAAVKHKYGM